jgi:hypothetical protein
MTNWQKAAVLCVALTLPASKAATLTPIARFASRRPPVIGFLLVVQMPDASDKRGVALPFCPIDCFVLRWEGGEHVVRVVFDDIMVDTVSLGMALGTRFNVNVRHARLSPDRVAGSGSA